MLRLRLSLFFIYGWATLIASAHDAGLSTGRVVWGPTALAVTLTYAPADVSALLSARNTPIANLDLAHRDAAGPRLIELARQLLDLRLDEAPLRLLDQAVEVQANNNIEFRLRYERPKPGKLTISSLRLGEMPNGHREFISIISGSGDLVARKLLTKTSASVEVGVTARSFVKSAALPGAPSFLGFFKLGVEHIPTGYDHLFFLLGLLLVCEGWRQIFIIISCFTVAHSITLALATFDLVQVPTRWVDPCIAASILYIGFENLFWRGVNAKRRWAVTFCFGLIHGFGFATVLRELGVGQGDGTGVALPLLAFNLGVEVGQICIAAVALPLLWHLKKSPRFNQRAIPMMSGLIAIMGLYWLLERLAFLLLSPRA